VNPQEILILASETLGKRRETHGDYATSLADIAEYWRVYFKQNGYGKALSPRDTAMLMILLKVARAKNAPGNGDNYVDIAGYAALAGALSDDNQG